MSNHFYDGPKLKIGKDFIKIKERNILLDYSEIKSVSIRTSRLSKAWLLYIISGMIAMSVILILLFMVVYGLLTDSGAFAGNRLFTNRRIIILLMLIFIGGPFFIVYKIQKYFRKYLMLIIRWDHRDFRIKISDLKIDVNELKVFLERKIEVQMVNY